MIISRKNAYMLETNRLAFGEDLDSFVDPGAFLGLLTISIWASTDILQCIAPSTDGIQ